jgi:YHS domain-containing protein
VADVTDPVCGMVFPEEGAEELGALKVERGGKTHWFCCPTCQKEFLAAPDKYA